MRKTWEGNERRRLLAAGLLFLLFLFFGWKYQQGTRATFPLFSDAAAWVDCALENLEAGAAAK